MHADTIAATVVRDEAVAGRLGDLFLESGAKARADGIGALAFNGDGGARIVGSEDTSGNRGDERESEGDREMN